MEQYMFIGFLTADRPATGSSCGECIRFGITA